MQKLTQYFLANKLLSSLLLIFWCGLIFFLSSQSQLPGAPVGWLDFAFKKAAHMSVYAVLYFLSFQTFSTKEKKHFLHAAVFTFLYAVSDELHQSFVPGRSPKLYDVGFDMVGMLGMMFKLKGYI